MKKIEQAQQTQPTATEKKVYERPAIVHHASLSSLVCGAAGSGTDGQGRVRPGQDGRP